MTTYNRPPYFVLNSPSGVPAVTAPSGSPLPQPNGTKILSYTLTALAAPGLKSIISNPS